MEKRYLLVQTKEQVNELINHINEHELLAFDTETDSLNPRTGSVIGWSVSGKQGEGYYLPTLVYNPESDKLVEQFIDGISAHSITKKLLNGLLAKKLIMHNGSFDIQFVKNYYDIDLTPSLYADTTLLVHTVYEEGAFGYGNPFGLKSIAIMNQQELGLDVEKSANEEQILLKESIKKNGGNTSKVDFEIFKADLDILAEYGAADTDLTLRIYHLYLQKLKQENLEKFFFEDEVMPIYKEVTIPMEAYGIELDLDLIHQTSESIQEDLKINKKIVVDSLLKTSSAKNWVIDSALKTFPPKNKGSWAQELVKRYNLPLPKSKTTNKYRLTQNLIKELEDSPVKTFLLEGKLDVLEDNEILRISTDLWKESNNGEYINIQSKKHLSELIFKYFGEKSTAKTKAGSDQFDNDTIEILSKKYEWAENLRIYNKLVKINSTYVERFLNGHENGRYYFYFKQHGTVSGRYGSDAQQLPKPKEEGEDVPIIVRYNNLIRAFLIAGEGRSIIDSDYESLEPHVFASIADDVSLREIFRKGHDFYSTVAIKTEKLEGVSADKLAPNFLKKVNPVKRNQAKAYSLGIAYGMGEYALGMTLNIPTAQAKELVNGYLDGFPGLKKWRQSSRDFVKENGYITNYVGRIRHLPKVKKIYNKFGDKMLDWRFRKSLMDRHGKDEVMQIYRDYRNGLNNCLNFQLQSMGAAIVNRAALAINRKAKELNIDATIQAQIHDQLIINIREDQAKDFAPIVQKLMENVIDLPGVQLKAPPSLSNNFRDGH